MRILSIILLLLLTACGFQPVHGVKSAETALSQTALETIKVEVPAKGRTAQLYRIALEDTLHPANLYPEPHYRLVSTLEEIKQPIIIERDAQITRYNLILKAHYELFDIATGESLKKKVSQRVSSYNVSDSDFATFMGDRDARENGIKVLTQTIAMELAAFLGEAP